ncbi:MAG: hypothetical protein K9L68_05550 [Spirochaetales bacterium]|nr:hypothetical protein [Spirochaetales bacterium]MCF7938044.1 hypothetical protein [Spirochaetales bacterium]
MKQNNNREGIRNRKNLYRILSMIAMLFVLNTALTVYRWLPEYRFLWLIVPSFETVGLALWFVLASWIRTKKDGQELRRIEWVISAVFLVIFLFGLGEAFNRYVFSRGFVPWSDLRFLGPLIKMMLGETTVFLQILYVLFIAAVVAGSACGIRFSITKLRRTIQPLGKKALLIPLFLLLPALFFPGGTPISARMGRQLIPPSRVQFEDSHAELSQSQPPSRTQNPVHEDGNSSSQGSPTAKDDRPKEPSPLREAAAESFPFLDGRDIHLFIIESYGRTLFSREDHYRLISERYAEIENQLTEAGYFSVSGFIEAPTTGGRSWFSDATLLTGVWIDSQHTYDQILHSGRKNLTHELGEAGYHRVMAAPGTDKADETWRNFYRFDSYLFREAYDYSGPTYSFGDMPDQYFLFATDQKLAEIPAGRPCFIMYMMVSSHTPFHIVPGYVEDWGELSDGSIFHSVESSYFDNGWLSGDEYPEGYTASIDYSLTTISDYLVNFIRDDSLIIIVGDHQPRFPVRERNSGQGVPIHLVSKKSELLLPFIEAGFSAGFEPDLSPPAQRMDEFIRFFLDVIRASGKQESGN